MARDYDYSREELSDSGSDEGDVGNQGLRGDSGGDGILGLFPICVFCCCCCCICIIPICTSIIAAVTSRGLTACGAAVPLLNVTNGTTIPPYHILRTPVYQWSNYFSRESSVYDPRVSNISRIGYWRTTKTWYLRDQWAYVVEGHQDAHIVTWSPMFSWTRTFQVEHCHPPKTYTVSQNAFVWGWNWGQSVRQWQVYSGAQALAQANHVKQYNWYNPMPPGWQSVVTSAVYPNVTIGGMVQNIASYWVRDSMWTVQDYRPDLLEPFVLSFMAAGFDIASSRRRSSSNHNRRRYRRLGAPEKEAGAADEEASVNV